MQRFEYVEGAHAKFWTINRAGAKVTTTWGRIGTAGQSKTKPFALDALAEKEVARLVASKTREGYQAARATAASKPTKPPKGGTPAKPPGRGTRGQTPSSAIPAAELWAFGQAIRKHAAPKTKSKHEYHLWSEVPKFSKRLTLYFWPSSSGRVPSVGGQVCFGNFADPKSALQIKAGGDDNRIFQFEDSALKKLRQDLRLLKGLRLSEEMPVRWEPQRDFVPTINWRGYGPRQSRVGFWSPGVERKSPGDFDGRFSWPSPRKGVLAWYSTLRQPVKWMLGVDAKGQPACVVAGAALDFDSFYFGRETLSAACADEAEATAKAIQTAEAEAAAEAAAKEAAENPAPTPATAAELNGIAAAIAAGPSKTRRRINKRFSLDWEEAAIPTVKGRLCVGDPGGSDFELDTGVDRPKAVFFLNDDETDEAGWGRIILGVRLGDGKAVKWKPSFGVGVDSGLYGVWSPDFPIDDITAAGTHTHGALVARIVETSAGDCGFPSLLGLDAAGKPVVILFGEALRLNVFKLAR